MIFKHREYRISVNLLACYSTA